MADETKSEIARLRAQIAQLERQARPSPSQTDNYDPIVGEGSDHREQRIQRRIVLVFGAIIGAAVIGWLVYTAAGRPPKEPNQASSASDTLGGDSAPSMADDKSIPTADRADYLMACATGLMRMRERGMALRDVSMAPFPAPVQIVTPGRRPVVACRAHHPALGEGRVIVQMRCRDFNNASCTRPRQLILGGVERFSTETTAPTAPPSPSAAVKKAKKGTPREEVRPEDTGPSNPETVEAPAIPEPAGSLVISNPDWLRRPSADEMATYFPTRAQNLSRPGRATLNCKVTASGTLTGCSIASEDPADFGFGQAALRMSKLFKMRPRTADGRSVEGASVTIPIRFSI